MKIGMIGLGKMGYNLSLNLRDQGYEVVAYDVSEATRQQARKDSILVASSIKELTTEMDAQRIIWMMVPAGEIVDQIIMELSRLLDKEDIIIDGGNSHYKDTIRRHQWLREKNIYFVDAGTSGGISGARNGACLMVGSDVEIAEKLETVFSKITVQDGYLHTGPPGSGHYVKMVHNGIEYGMMQAIAEGFQVLKSGPYDLDYHQVAGVWNHGSVIRGWLMELTENLFAEDPELETLKGVIGSSGEGLWTLQEALERKVPVPVLAASLFTRFDSEAEDSFSNKVVAGLRNQFGGHSVIKKQEE